jgi:hypothetical protein
MLCTSLMHALCGAPALAATRHISAARRSIHRLEWDPLCKFLEERKVRIHKVDEVRQGPGFAGAAAQQDAALAALDAELEEEEEKDDEDFGVRRRRRC